MNPQIGIWWDNGEKIVAFPHPPGDRCHETGWCDSEDSHNDFWPEAAMQFSAGIDDEYFSIPRGRVLWNPVTRKSVIYHGDATSAERLRESAKVFKLTDWTSSTDTHYMTGSAADREFDIYNDD